MPTNKKKSKNAGTKSHKAAATAAPSVRAPAPVSHRAPFLQGPQLTALILLSIGVSRILQVRASYAIEKDDEPVTICVQHLGVAACTNAIILSLLKYKYATALQLTILVASALVKLWNKNMADLARFNTLLCMTPLLIGIGALCVNRDGIGSGVLLSQFMVGLVLIILCAPTSLQMLPFYGQNRNGSPGRKSKTVSALVLWSLTVWNLLQSASYIWMTTTSRATVDTTATTLWWRWFLPLQPDALSSLPLELQIAAKPIVYFLAVDCLTTAAICAYCWHALSYQSHRVSVHLILYVFLNVLICLVSIVMTQLTMEQSHAHSLTLP